MNQDTVAELQARTAERTPQESQGSDIEIVACLAVMVIVFMLIFHILEDLFEEREIPFD